MKCSILAEGSGTTQGLQKVCFTIDITVQAGDFAHGS